MLPALGGDAEPREHLVWRWLPWQAAAEQVFSPSNADAIRLLPARLARAAQPA